MGLYRLKSNFLFNLNCLKLRIKLYNCYFKPLTWHLIQVNCSFILLVPHFLSIIDLMLQWLMNYFNNECFVAIALFPYFLNYYSNSLILTKTYFFYYDKTLFQFLNLSMLVFKVFSCFYYFHKPEVISRHQIHFQMR